VTAAGALLTVVVVMLVVMLLMVVVAVIIVVVMMLVTVALAVAIIVVMVVIVVVMVTVAAAIIIVMMVMVMSAAFGADLLILKSLKGIGESIRLFHCRKDLGAGKNVPIRCNDLGIGVVSADKLNGLCKLFLGETLGVAENDSTCAFDLVVEEFTEILHIHLALLCIYHCGCRVESDICKSKILHSLDNVGELTYTGGLDKDPFGSVGFDDLGESLSEIAHERAADAAGVHLRDLNACLLKKSAVDTDIAELVFNNYQLFACKGLADKLFYKCCLSGSEKAGENIDFNHYDPSFCFAITLHYITALLIFQGEDVNCKLRVRC